MPKLEKNYIPTCNSLQQKYKVSEEEFAKTPKTKVSQAYKNFARMAGEKVENYPAYKNE